EDDVGARQGGGVVEAAWRSADQPNPVVSDLERSGDRVTQWPIAQDDCVHRSLPPRWSRSRCGREAIARGRITKPRSPDGVRGPGSLQPGGSSRLVACAPSEPRGPCLPAGPPELLLRLVGQDDAAHVHILQWI